MLKCECGREFENSQSFNGHKSNCHVHLLAKYGTLDLYYAKCKASAEKSGKKNANAAIKRKEAKLQQWVLEQHTCEHCGKVMTEKFGPGRFCSRTCANSRNHSEETKAKISKATSGTEAYFNPATLEVKYFRANNIPDGWYKGNIAAASDKEAWVASLGNPKLLEPGVSSVKSYKTRTAKYYTELKKFKEAFLAQQTKANEEVLAQYIELLQQKINGRQFVPPANMKSCGKYLCIESNTHPRALKYKTYRVHVHIVMAEELLGRYLTDDEVVHHRNENKLDNRFDNILIFDSQASHARFHNTLEYILRIDNDRLVCDKLAYPKFNYITN